MTAVCQPNFMSQLFRKALCLPSATVVAERLCLHRCLSVHGGRCTPPGRHPPPHSRQTPPGQTPPADTPPLQTPPRQTLRQADTPPWADTPRQTPPWADTFQADTPLLVTSGGHHWSPRQTPQDGYCSGR